MKHDLNSFIPSSVAGEERKKMQVMLADRLGQVVLETALVVSTEAQKQELLEKLRSAGGGEKGLLAITEFTATIPGLTEAVEQAMDRELAAVKEVMGW